jgi:Glutaredoxin
MKAQRLKSFKDFLKRAEIIPHALLIITKENCEDCEKAIAALRVLHYEVAIYELSLTNNPELKKELDELYQIKDLPTFLYFRGKDLSKQVDGFDGNYDFTSFLNSAIHQSW